MSSSQPRRLQAFAAGLLLAVIVVGTPLLLARIVGWQLPREVPDIGRVRTALGQGDIPAQTVVSGLAVIVWVIWLQIAWATAWELLVNARRLDRGERPSTGPFVMPWVHSNVARLVAVAFSATVVATATAAPVLATRSPAHVAIVVPDVDLASGSAMVDLSAKPSVGAGMTWVVHADDSLWRISEVALGDGARAGEILDLNPTLRSSRDVRAGQHLRLPIDAQIPDDRQGAGSVAPSGFLPAAEVEIKRGDNLWNLSADRLTTARGVEPAPADVVSYLDRVIELNAAVVEDPNLIYPGEVFAFPAVGDPPPEPAAPESPGPEQPVPPSPVVPDVAAGAEPEPVAEPLQVAASEVDEIRPNTGSVREIETLEAPAASDASAPADQPESDSSVPALAGITGSIALATGLLLLERRRRMRRASVGARALRRPRRDPEAMTAIVRSGDVALMRWADHELAVAFADLDPKEEASPVAVEVSELFGMEVLWDRPVPHAPARWTATNAGWAWRIDYDPEAPVPERVEARPLPGLVTIGKREGRQVLVDLESFPTLKLAGPDELVGDLLRSMVVELAVADSSPGAFMRMTNVVEEGFDSLERVSAVDGESCASAIVSLVAAHRGLLDEADLRDMFQLRRVDGLGREVTLFVAGDGVDLPTGVPPRHGVGVITSDVAVSGDARIVIDGEHVARLEPLGLTFEPALLPLSTSARVMSVLDESTIDDDGESTPLVEPEEIVQTIVHETEFAELDLETDDGAETARPRLPEVLVRLIGPPDVPAFPALGRMDLNVVAFLACAGGSTTVDQLIDAVWSGRLVEKETVWNRMSKVRAIVGDLLPRREQGSSVVGLDAAVGTDVGHFAAVVEYSNQVSTTEAIETLTEALQLVRGVPFDAAGYDWAHQRQHLTRACELVEAAGLRLAEIALDVGDVATARFAVSQALCALPANEPLYRCRMQIEAAANNLQGVRSAYNELLITLDDWGDGLDAEPSSTTADLFLQLTRRTDERSAS